MKAVIMAGGKGTRLRPLTCDKPKPLIDLCGRPVLEYILELIGKNDISSGVITLHYLGDMIKNHFENGVHGTVELDFCFEDKPLGTAGGVRYALADNTQEVLVMSGDAMCDFNLKEAVRFHHENNADATLIVKQVDDPREYGLVSADNDGRIKGFLEKPSFTDCTTDLANTGIYILSKRAVELIQKGENLDFATDIFPKMLKDGMRLFAFEDTGYWCDIGDLKSYLKCQEDMLLGKVKCDIHGYDKKGVFIGSNSSVGKGSKIAQGTVIGQNVTIGENCKISGVILNGTNISDGVTVNRAIIGENVNILNSAGIYEFAVIGSGATVEEFAQVCGDVKIWNDKTVHSQTIIKDDIKYGDGDNIIIGDKGITGQTNSVISPMLCVKIGSAVASIKENSAVAVACDDKNASKALKQSVISGITASGADAYDLGTAIKEQFSYSVLKSGADFGIYIKGDDITTVSFTESDGLPLRRAYERKTEAGINRQEYKKSEHEGFGSIYNLTGITALYEKELLDRLKNISDKLSVNVKSSDTMTKNFLTGLFHKAGIKNGDGITLVFASDIDKLTAYSKYGDCLLHEQIMCLICLDMIKDKKDLALPLTAPHIIDALADMHNTKVYRYNTNLQSQTDKKARELSLEMPYFNDTLQLGIKLIEFLDKNNMSIGEALRLIPEFTVIDRFVAVSKNPGRVIKSLNSKVNPSREKYGARLTIHPIKSGKGIFLSIEAQNSETANELCDFYEKEIKKIKE